MKQQVREYVRSAVEYVARLGKLGWCFGLLTLGSGILSTISQVQKKELYAPSWVWLALLGVGLVATPFIAFHHQRMDALKDRHELEGRIESLDKRVADIEDKRPTVHVSPHCNGKVAWLTIRNTGGYGAEFGFTITLFGIKLRPEDSNMSYEGKWKGVRDRALILIAPTHEPSADIAETEGIDLDKNEVVHIFTALETKNGIMPPGKTTMTCEVQVYSIPALKQDFKKRYTLRIDPETHHMAEFTEEKEPKP